MREIGQQGNSAADSRPPDVKLGPTRRDCYCVLVVVVVVCLLAPFRGITFVVMGVTAVELPNLPVQVRLLALVASFCLVSAGIFRVVNNI